MVAPPVDPAGQTDSLSDIGLAKLAAGVGAIGVHERKTIGKRRVLAVLGGQVKAASPGPEKPIFSVTRAV
jgi:hypothetical protein